MPPLLHLCAAQAVSESNVTLRERDTTAQVSPQNAWVVWPDFYRPAPAAHAEPPRQLSRANRCSTAVA